MSFGNYFHNMLVMSMIMYCMQEGNKLVKVAEVVADVREKLRTMSKDKSMEAIQLRTQMLTLCDAIRDDLLPPLGVRLEDRDDGKYRVFLLSQT